MRPLIADESIRLRSIPSRIGVAQAEKIHSLRVWNPKSDADASGAERLRRGRSSGGNTAGQHLDKPRLRACRNSRL